MAGEAKDRFEPLRQFNFLVDFGEGDIAGFQEVSGLDMDPGAGGERTIAFKRGVCIGPGIFNWLFSSQAEGVVRRRVLVRLMDEGHRPVAEWTLTGAWPARMANPVGPAKAAEFAVEQVDLACERLEKDLHSGRGPN